MANLFFGRSLTPEQHKALGGKDLKPADSSAPLSPPDFFDAVFMDLKPGALTALDLATYEQEVRRMMRLMYMPPPMLRDGGLAEELRKRLEALPSGTQFGELVGWRSWKVAVTPEGHARLKSSHMSTIWPSGIVTGKDGEGNSSNVQAKFRDAGWYAYKTAAQLMQDSEKEDVRVGGKVQLWGAVVEHEKGYRAECMRILTLEAIGPRAALVIDELRDFYIPKGN